MKSNLQGSLAQVEAGIDNHYNICYAYALLFLSKTSDPFTSEDLIECYLIDGYPMPREKRVFGAVIRQLLNYCLIKHNGIGKYKKKSGHSKLTNIWIRL